MNKQALINQLAFAAEVNQVQAERVFDALTATIIDTLRNGGELKIGELGRFSTKIHAARAATNPRTQERIEVPARRVAKFKPGKTMLAALK